MSYYKKLNLPANPFKDWTSIYNQVKEQFPPGKQATSYHAIYDSAGLLTEELEEILSSIGVKVTHIVLFCSGRSITVKESRLIHSDITWDEDLKAWKDCHCGINWELGGTNDFSWWDMSKTKPVYPIPPYSGYGPNGFIINKTSAILNGINFDNRLQLGIHANAVQLDEVRMDGPMLVRTDVPHLTAYRSQKIRVGVSLRIDESELDSWYKITDRFAPLFKV
jgi:hypothetical protein